MWVKILGMMAIVVMVSACVARDYAAQELPYWSRSGDTAEDFRLERKTCVDAVELGLYEESYVDPLFRQGPAALRQAAMGWAREEYLGCMHDKGWRLAQGARIEAPGEIYYP